MEPLGSSEYPWIPNFLSMLKIETSVKGSPKEQCIYANPKASLMTQKEKTRVVPSL